MAVRASVFEWLGQPDRVARLDLLHADSRFGLLEDSDELAFLLRRDGKDEASDQELKDSFFENLDERIGQTEFPSSLEVSRLSA